MQEVIWVIGNLTPTDILDILLVGVFFFVLSLLFRGTQAGALFRGILIIAGVLILATGLLNLRALAWLLNNGLIALAVAIPVIFQPELRRALEQVGRGNMGFFRRQAPENNRASIINEIVRASERLSERRHGALIVLARNSALDEYIRTGIRIDSEVNAELLLTIFWPKTELHDGAVIVNDDGRIASAAAVLPLTASRNLPNPKMGTRHRAALGISEVSDAICVVISEETGKIGVTNGGRMVSRLDLERLRTILNAFYAPDTQESSNVLIRFKDWLQSALTRTPESRQTQS